jgi:hypothetical protein
MNWRSLVEGIVSSLPVFATFFLSVAVVLIAWLQWRVARNKLRLDLFDRRYKVYEATRKFLGLILRNGAFTDLELTEFELATSDAKFLFGDDVVQWLEEIRKRALHLRTTQKLLSRPRDDHEVAKRAQAEHDDLLWLTDEIATMKSVFTRYLGFGHVK